MAAIITNNLAGFTVVYNGVQFGGGDSDNPSTPPTYSLEGRFVYDDAGIAVKHTEYLLTVNCVFSGTNEIAMANNADDLKLKLSQPGKQLIIQGLGIGFGIINQTEEYGPQPQGFNWRSYGFLAWEVVWSVKFCIKHCTSNQHTVNAFTAFNFSTSWQNDFEGLTRRTIQGHVEIVGKRKMNGTATTNAIAHVADEVRNQLKIRVPTGFRRVVNSWQENARKNRLDFAVVDEVLPGTAPPQGITMATGSTTVSSEGPGVGNQWTQGISMELRTHPAAHPALAGSYFLAAAMAKQQSLNVQEKGKDGKLIQGAVAVPRSLSITNHKYDGARVTSASMSWTVTRCAGSMMKQAGIWEPLTPNNYNLWVASISNLWDNRGAIVSNSGRIASNPAEALIIDLCQNKTTADIGKTGIESYDATREPTFKFVCPTIPPDGGWVFQDLKIRILRNDMQTWHKKGTPYTPEPVTSIIGSVVGALTGLGDPSYESSPSTQHDVEQHGLPDIYVALQYRALRAQHKPTLPIIAKIGGMVPIQIKHDGDAPFIAFDSFGCPVWGIRGYRIYRVNGYISAVGATESKSSCSMPNGDKTVY